MDKIKAAAKTKEGGKEEESSSSTPTETKGTSRTSWGALKDDYMLGSKKVSVFIFSLDICLDVTSIFLKVLANSHSSVIPQKNWDEESSDEENDSDPECSESYA